MTLVTTSHLIKVVICCVDAHEWIAITRRSTCHQKHCICIEWWSGQAGGDDVDDENDEPREQFEKFSDQINSIVHAGTLYGSLPLRTGENEKMEHLQAESIRQVTV